MNNSREEVPEALMIRIQEWPVLERLTTSEGALKRSRESYRRSKAPTRERDVEVVDIPAATRVAVYFGGGAEVMAFSVKTGRCVGRMDWIIEATSLREIRKFFKSDEMVAALAIDRAFRALAPRPEEDDAGALPPAEPDNDVG